MSLRYPIGWLTAVDRYLRSSGKRCFGYDGFRAWMRRQRVYSDVSDRTIYRVLRRLAEDGYLERRYVWSRRGNRRVQLVIFCITEEAQQLLARTFSDMGIEYR